MTHLDEPELVVDTKAVAALCLGVIGAATGWAVGGLVPATIGLALARQAAADLAEGQGWRTGHDYVRWARRLAWVGVASAMVALTVLFVFAVWRAVTRPQDFPPNVN